MNKFVGVRDVRPVMHPRVAELISLLRSRDPRGTHAVPFTEFYLDSAGLLERSDRCMAARAHTAGTVNAAIERGRRGAGMTASRAP
ncbi:hypothetical protein [Actinomadura litoris]|uniref:hypothetical protein n=1 Tax=Actinomadura litoris TaxID=2678616 RepID=UPI001FA7FFCC|nr:hypothetical protein [Actinomadura litoris]